MTSATDELRRLLDERGVEWETVTESIGFEHVIWKPNDTSRWDWNEEFGTGWLSGHQSGLTPEQAVAATLGPGTCHMQRFESGTNMTRYGWSCSECGMRAIGFGAPIFCPNCGRRVVG